MTQGYKVLDLQLIGELQDERRDFALHVLEGLSERPKRLSSKYFYDAQGSQYFSRIMDLDAYYLTRCEREILEAHAEAILAPLEGAAFNLVDLGAGDGRKTMILLEHLHRLGADVRYVPIDISEAAVSDLVQRTREALPGLDIAGLVADYMNGLRWLSLNSQGRSNLLLFLGSNIGNFTRPRARALLRQLWNSLVEGDRVLIGFDLKKDIEQLLLAYNDPEGVTSAFNLNLLSRINLELGADFDVSQFRHFSTYNVFSGAMESYLVSLTAQDVSIEALNQSFHFDPWEPIHTEYSYKYLESDTKELADRTGFVIEARYHDSARWFTNQMWRVVRGSRDGGR